MNKTELDYEMRKRGQSKHISGSDGVIKNTPKL